MPELAVDRQVVGAVIDYHCIVARRHKIFFLWRPLLRDPGDEMVLELAVTSSSDAIVTYNKRDLADAERFGIDVLEPGEFLRRIGALP